MFKKRVGLAHKKKGQAKGWHIFLFRPKNSGSSQVKMGGFESSQKFRPIFPCLVEDHAPNEA